MSDVMPYASTVFSSMPAGEVETYRHAWRRHLQAVIQAVEPDVIHSHHVWIVSSLLKDVAPEVPVATQCHATGFRQMELCPHLEAEIRAGCARNDRFLALHREHAERLARALGVPDDRIRVIGAGYRDDLFHATDRVVPPRGRLLYIGKYAAAKGLPWLLEALEAIFRERPDLELHVAGGGSGAEADALRARMSGMVPNVVLHGQLPQTELAELMRRCSVCVLPSFYEGLPLVLVEAFASGCRLVATALPGVVEQLAPPLGDALEVVPLPRMITVDTPDPDDLPGFVADLRAGLELSLDKPPLGDPATTMPEALRPMTWAAVFDRVESVWRELLDVR
jgi:glycosyltransferase involved in cell wall biosynthesis